MSNDMDLVDKASFVEQATSTEVAADDFFDICKAFFPTLVPAIIKTLKTEPRARCHQEFQKTDAIVMFVTADAYDALPARHL